LSRSNLPETNETLKPSVEYYTKWIEIAKLSSLSSNNVICHLKKSQFAKYGIPDELISDNGL